MNRAAGRKTAALLVILLLGTGAGIALRLRGGSSPREALDLETMPDHDARLEREDGTPFRERSIDPPAGEREQAEPSTAARATEKEVDPPTGMASVSVYPWDIAGGPPFLIVMRPIGSEGNTTLPQFGLTEWHSSNGVFSSIQSSVPAGHWSAEAHPRQSLTPELQAVLEDRRSYGYQFAASDRVPPEGTALVARPIEIPADGRGHVALSVPYPAELAGRVQGWIVNPGRVSLDEIHVGLKRSEKEQGPVELSAGGTFDSGWVPPGELELSVSLRTKSSTSLVHVRRSIELRVGETVEVPVELPPNIERTIEVIDAVDETPVEDVVIRLYDLDASRIRTSLRPFERTHLLVSTYALWIQDRDHRAQYIELTTDLAEPSATITVRLEPVEPDRRTLIDENGAPFGEGAFSIIEVGGAGRQAELMVPVSKGKDGTFDAARLPRALLGVQVYSRGLGLRRGTIDLRLDSDRTQFVPD